MVLHLKRIRHECGLTLAQAVAGTGHTAAWLSMVERGVHRIYLTDALSLAQKYGRNLGDLASYEASPPARPCRCHLQPEEVHT